jgi:hypothetical protein
MSSGELRKELETYESHRVELLATAENEFVLIHGADIMGTFETEVDAIKHGYRELGNVPFLVKKIVRVEHPENFVSNLIAI